MILTIKLYIIINYINYDLQYYLQYKIIKLYKINKLMKL
jgi:hypothetical protein